MQRARKWEWWHLRASTHVPVALVVILSVSEGPMQFAGSVDGAGQVHRSFGPQKARASG